MSELVAALTSLASSPATTGALDLAQVGSTGYNLYNQYQNQQYQNKLRSYAQDPAKMNAYAQQFTKPLDAGLTTGVANQAQSDLATRGLSDSPEIAQQVYAQAIAPYIQQNQQQGYQNALQALDLGGGAINPALQQQNSLSALTKAFSQLGGSGGQINPAIFAQLMQSGGVQPATLDTGGNDYMPDYGAGLGSDYSDPLVST
jgi:hypothetical protein